MDSRRPVNGDKTGPAFHHGLESLGSRALQGSFGPGIGIQDEGIGTLRDLLILRPLIGNDSLDILRLPKTFGEQLAGRQVNVRLGRVVGLVPDEQNSLRLGPTGRIQGKAEGK